MAETYITLSSLKHYDEKIKEVIDDKQEQLVGAEGQIVSFDADGNVISKDLEKIEIDTSDFVTKEEGKGLFSGSYNDLTDKPEIPSVEGLASEDYVTDKIAEIEIPSLDGYAKTEDVPTVTNDLTDELKQSYDNAVADSHTHDNKSVLDKLSETDEGILLFNGSEIQGGGEDAVIPYIGDNGNWYVNENDTGVPATGQDGMSAYEVAVAFNGFEGTEEEWLESLEGADGISPLVNIGGNGNSFVDGVDTGISAKGEKGDTGQGFSATKHYNTIDEMMADTEPANESEVVVVINGDVGNFYLRLSSYVDPDGITNGYLPIGNTEDISAIQGEKGEDGATPVIDPNTKHWFIDGIDTGVVAEGANGVTPHIGANSNWFIGETDTGILAKGKDGRSIVSIVKDNNNNIIVTFSDNTTENIGELSVDIQGDFLTENGFGNLRYYEGKFQYYDTVTSAWIDTSVSPENVYIMQMIPQAMESFDGLYDIDLGKNKLKWKEPKDTIID